MSTGPSAPSKDRDAAYVAWRDNIPFLYDWITHSHFVWPALSCAWGGVTGIAAPTPAVTKGPAWRATQTIQRALYYSSRTGTWWRCPRAGAPAVPWACKGAAMPRSRRRPHTRRSRGRWGLVSM